MRFLLALLLLLPTAAQAATALSYTDTRVPLDRLGVDVPEGDLATDLANPADLRETKVTGPEETKPASKKGKKS